MNRLMHSMPLIMLILCSVIGSFVSASDVNCPLFVDAVGAQCSPKIPYSKTGRTTFWAQEYAGTDLVREEMKQIHGLKYVDLAIMDLGFESAHVPLTEPLTVPQQMSGKRKMKAHHGTAMANIIHGPAPYGATDQIHLMGLHAIPASSYYIYILQKYEEKERIPKVISNSLGWSHANVADAVQSAYDKGVFWFLAAGNSFPKPIRDFEITSRAFAVGSFSPLGWTSFETQNHPDLLVLSPADEFLATIDGNGLHSHIGQSSGGNAMAAATAANILSILPSISHEQYRSLIKNSAFDSIENKLGLENYPKLLNAFKAFQVAKRIRSICANQEPECLSQHLNLSQTYQFESEPVTCNSVLKSKGSTQKDLFLKLRRNTLLGVTGQANELTCVYQNFGFSENAQFYQFVSSTTMDISELEHLSRKELLKGQLKFPLYRFMSLFDASIETFIKTLPHFSDFEKKELLQLRSVKFD